MSAPANPHERCCVTRRTMAANHAFVAIASHSCSSEGIGSALNFSVSSQCNCDAASSRVANAIDVSPMPGVAALTSAVEEIMPPNGSCSSASAAAVGGGKLTDSRMGVGLSSNFLNAMNVDSEEERRFWTVYATLYWATAFATAEEQKEFFETFHAELQSDDFVAEMYRFFIQLDLVDGIPSRIPKGQVPLSRLQRTSRAAGEDSLVSFYRELIEDDGEYLNNCEQDSQRLVDLDGKQRFKNAYLSAKHKAYCEKRHWERASWEGVTTKMAFMDIQTPGLFTKCWCEDGKRGYVIDLDALRALCKSDVRTQRAILANRRAHEDLDRELRHLQSKPLMRGSLEEKELEARQQVLNARFEELLRPNKDDNDDEEREDFDAEAEFERVMGSTVLKPHIPGELGDVEFLTDVTKRKAEDDNVEDDADDVSMEGEQEWTLEENLAWDRGYRHGDEPDLHSYELDAKEGWIVPKLFLVMERNPTQYGPWNKFWFQDGVPKTREYVRFLRGQTDSHGQSWSPSILPAMDFDAWHLVGEKYSFERDANT